MKYDSESVAKNPVRSRIRHEISKTTLASMLVKGEERGYATWHCTFVGENSRSMMKITDLDGTKYDARRR